MTPIASKNSKMHWSAIICTAKSSRSVAFALMASIYLDSTPLFTIFSSSEHLALLMVSVPQSPNQSISKLLKNHGSAPTVSMLSAKCY
jgi:hypothetical protein